MSTARKRIVFVSTVMGTRWQAYSQALVRRAAFRARVLLTDGTRNWHPLNFLEAALRHDSDYIVHIDEDCFLFDPPQLASLIDALDGMDGHLVAGTPDGGMPWREHNPLACNLFLTVFKTQPLRELLASNPEYRKLRFQDEWREATARDWRTVQSGQFPYAFDECEPYYPLFWLILKSGWRILYLKANTNPEWRGSDVSWSQTEGPMATHMWHLRYWFHAEIDTRVGISNRQRYELVKAYMDSLASADPLLRWHLLREFGRLILQRWTRRLRR